MTLSSTDPWTTRRLLLWTAERLAAAGVDDARLKADMLLAHALGCERLRLYADPERPASAAERDAFRALVKRALAREPVDYLVGEAPFFGLRFGVTRATLVPRPATETLVEFVLDQERAKPRADAPRTVRLADIGTGSGIIAITLAKFLPKSGAAAEAIATDISADAIEAARANAARHGVPVEFRQGDLLAPLAGDFAGENGLDYLLSNPPYIPDDEWDALEPEVKDWEPTQALRGGADGLDCVRPLLAHGAAHLKGGGWIAIELAAAKAAEAQRLAEQAGWLETRILKDHEGFPRILVGRKQD